MDRGFKWQWKQETLISRHCSASFYAASSASSLIPMRTEDHVLSRSLPRVCSARLGLLRDPTSWAEQLSRFSDAQACRWPGPYWVSCSNGSPFLRCILLVLFLKRALPNTNINWKLVDVIFPWTIQPAKAQCKANGTNSQECDLNWKLLVFILMRNSVTGS